MFKDTTSLVLHILRKVKIPNWRCTTNICRNIYSPSIHLSLSSLPHSHLNIRMMAVQYRSLPIKDILGCPLFFLFPFRYDLLVLQIVPFLNRCCSGSIPIILCGMVSFISRVSLNASCALIFMPYRYVIKNEEDPILSTLL